MLRAAGVPAPDVLRDDPDGLVLLSTGRGVALSGLLSHGMDKGRAARVFTSLAALLDTLPASALRLTPHPAWSERARHYAHAASTVLPHREASTTATASSGSQDRRQSSRNVPVPDWPMGLPQPIPRI